MSGWWQLPSRVRRLRADGKGFRRWFVGTYLWVPLVLFLSSQAWEVLGSSGIVMVLGVVGSCRVGIELMSLAMKKDI